MKTRTRLVLFSLSLFATGTDCMPRPIGGPAPSTTTLKATPAIEKDPEVQKALADLSPAQRDLTMRVLQARALREAKRVATMARDGRSEKEILDALAAGHSGDDAEGAAPGGVLGGLQRSEPADTRPLGQLGADDKGGAPGDGKKPGGLANEYGPDHLPPYWIVDQPEALVSALDGLTTEQRFVLLRLMNEKPCDCGCPHGSTVKCLAEDPNCPRAPVILKAAAAMAKQGKSYDEILAAVKKDTQTATATPAGDYEKVEIAAWSPVRGPKHAKVTLVVFSDFQCPFCGRFAPTLAELREKFGKDLRIVWRNQPLPFHVNAKPAAEAAMAAHTQGKFWEMHDKLFADQGALDEEHYQRYAREIGLDMKKFDAERKAHKHAAHIEQDAKDGSGWGANGTPTSFVNGRKLVGAQPASAFVAVIDEEIVHADKLLKRGVALKDLYATILKELPASERAKQKEAESDQPDIVVDVKVPADAPARGPQGAPVTIVEFSDFQCPFCGRVEPTLRDVEKKYKRKIRLVFMHQPLPFHAYAELAAEASMAAHAQGKFWQLHDKMFEHQTELSREALEGYAREIGLDVTKFKKALDDHAYADRVRADSEEGSRVGASGTPTFYLNGVALVGAQPIEAFAAKIDKLLKQRSGKADKSHKAKEK